MILSWNNVVALSIYPLLAPFYVYGFIKWYQWKTHLLFRLRYSLPEGLIIVVIALLNVHMAILRDVLDDFNHINDDLNHILTTAILTFVWIIFGTIYYRANLICLTYKQYQSRLHQMINTSNTNTKTFNATSPKRHCLTYILLIWCIGGLFIHILIYTLPFSKYGIFLWTCNYLVGFILFITIKIQKVHELIGCLFETYVTFIVTIVMLILIFIAKNKQRTRFIAYIFYHLWSLSTLYFPLYFVYKSEGTLRPKTKNEEFMSMSLQSVFSMDSIQSDKSEKENELKLEMKEIEKDIQNKSLKTFLCNRKDYEIFCKYLALCFCLECLMFIERVCIFRCIVVKLMNQNGVISNDNIDSKKKYYSLKFEFLGKIYKAYDDIINDEKLRTKSNDFQGHCNGLWLICNGIYNEFICDSALNQINIPYETRNGLENRLNSKKNIASHFKSYQDFLDLFDDCMYEQWRLLYTTYKFNFSSYLHQH